VDKPVCLVQKGKPSCVASGDGATDGAVVLQCASPSDCAGGQRCCIGGASVTYSSCQAGCGEGSEARLCNTDKDCAGGFGTKCGPRPGGGPSWIKQCQ
jgi:hypothetical protein